MYYIYAGIFFCILFYFGSSIKEAVLYYSSFNNKYLGIGNPWFFGGARGGKTITNEASGGRHGAAPRKLSASWVISKTV